MRRTHPAAIVALVIGCASPVRAEPGVATTPIESAPQQAPGLLPEGWFLPVGVGVASVSHSQGASGTAVGAEASVVYFPVGHGFWNGAYADGLYDTGSRRVRMSTGLEVGYVFLGVDGGPVAQVGEAPARFGLEVRPMLSLGVMHLYGRWGWLFGDAAGGAFREIGVLVKLPIRIADPS
jgi:hypothetical protein